MPLEKIMFQSGVNREGTQYSADTAWYDADKVRFRKGRVEKIGGWQKVSSTPIQGVPRGLKDWGTGDFSSYLSVGTTLKMYVESGGSYTDITPIRAETTGTTTFSCTLGSSTITVVDASHGAVDGDFVTFSNAATLGASNITSDVLNQEYQISLVVDQNTYEIIAKDTNGDEVVADATVSGGGGGSVDSEYQINVGLNTGAKPETGAWGSSTWSSGAWGIGSALDPSAQLRLWGQDIFGDDLIFNVRFGGVYYWDESVGGRANALSNSTAFPSALAPPTSALQVMVSDVDRHVICFGVNPIGSSVLDPLLIRWSDQENAFDWLPTATNSAGGQVLSTGTQIVGAVKTRQEIIIFTDEGIQSMRFVGSPFIYSFSVVANNTSMVSPRAAVAITDSVYFMDTDGFYIYSGSVQRIPCSVHAYVFDNINREQISKVFAVNNPDFSEVTWFYPVGEGVTEATNYVTFNYQEQSWAIGTMTRGSYISAQTRSYPVAGSANIADQSQNYIYNQEVGYDADGSELVSYVETGGFDLSNGERFAFCKRFIPDFRFNGNAESALLEVTIKGRDFPLDDFANLSTTSIISTSKQAHIRTRAREMAVRIQSSGTGYGWTLGDMRFDFRTDGKR